MSLSAIPGVTSTPPRSTVVATNHYQSTPSGQERTVLENILSRTTSPEDVNAMQRRQK